MARPSKYTNAQIKEALYESGGVIKYAAEILGCSQQNLSYHIGRKKILRDYMDEFLPSITAAAKACITNAIYEGNISAAMFHLKCKAGYQEKIQANVEISHDDWVKKMEEIDKKRS